MKTLTILFIVTSQAFMGDGGKPTGVWLEELATPYYALKDAGYEVEIASIKGGEAPVDPQSISQEEALPPSVTRFLADKEARQQLKDTPAITEIDADTYQAVFLPGGHGTMWDLPENQQLAEIVSDTLQDGRVVAAVCHGPAGLVNATYASGEPVVKGRKIAAFTNDEEAAVGLTDTVPFLLETRLRELGAVIHKAPNFEPFAIADGTLITGQNPASSAKVAELVINALAALQNKQGE